MDGKMWAMVLPQAAPVQTAPLEWTSVPIPTPGEKEILVKVTACGVCRTDLHVVEGDLTKTRYPIIPGHQVVGTVAGRGPGAVRFQLGDRVGIAWLRRTCQACIYCRTHRENLCSESLYTGYLEDGGYAEYAVVLEEYAYAIPGAFTDAEATPLMCAGIIGFRALRRSACPDGGRLGIYGFGSSAHVTMQVAQHRGCSVYVATRDAKHRELAQSMGAQWVGGTADMPPEPLDSAIVFAPAGEIVPAALRAVGRGGTVALAGVTMSQVPAMDYDQCLFHEKNLCSVEANTRQDGKDLLAAAAEIPLRPVVTTFPLQEANTVLRQLKEDAFRGSSVLIV